MEKTNDTLNYLGSESQMQIVKALIEQPRFFNSMYPVLNQNCFTAEGGKLSEIVRALKDYYSKYSIPADYKQLVVMLNERAKDEFSIEENEAIINELKKPEYNKGMEFIKDKAKAFFRQQEFIKIMKNGVDKVGTDGISEKLIRDTISRLTNTLRDDTASSVSLYDTFLPIMDEDIQEGIRFGIKELDEATNGMMRKKMVSLFIAGTGMGKTTFFSILANKMALQGYKVLQIFFEEDVKEIGRRHYAHLSKKYLNELNSKGDKKAVWDNISSNDKKCIKENLELLRMDNGKTTVEMIDAKIDEIAATKGFKPDVVFIDYLSCLQKSSNRNNEYTNEWKCYEQAMKKLEQMANDKNMLIWVAEQTNRNAAIAATKNDRVANVQGSYRITQPASFIFYLGRDTENKNHKSANLYMDKCRGCEPKEWLNIYLNNGNCQLDMSEVEYDGNPLSEEDKNEVFNLAN